MALAFPQNPAEGQVYDYPPFRYQFTSGRWLTVGKGANTVSEAILAHEAAPNIHSMAAIQWQGGLSHRNLLINGDFSVNQRYSYGTYPVQNGGGYYPDRWFVWGNGNVNWFMSLYTERTDGRNVLAAGGAAGSSGNTISLAQRIESNRVQHLVGKKVTFSIEIHSKIAVGFKIEIVTPKTRDSWLGGWDVISIGNYTSENGDIYKRYILTTDVLTASNVNKGLGVIITTSTPIGGGEHFAFSEAQLELGEVATPFEHRPYGYELSLCQRYYASVNVNGWCWPVQAGSSTRRGATAFPVLMRAIPTVSITSVGDPITIHEIKAAGFEYGLNSGTTNTYVASYTAIAEL